MKTTRTTKANKQPTRKQKAILAKLGKIIEQENESETTATQTLRAREDLYSSLTLEEKRMAVAYDVIQQIKKGMLQPVPSSFAVNRGRLGHKGGSLFREVFVSNNPKSDPNTFCYACAIGGVLISSLLFKNNTMRAGGGFRYPAQNLMEKSRSDLIELAYGINSPFTRLQLNMIESAFEQNQAFYPGKDRLTKQGERNASKAVSFGEKYKDDSERLVAIMQNIINNRGEFKP